MTLLVRMPKCLILLQVWAVLALGAQACGGDASSASQPCTTAADCSLGAICTEGACMPCQEAGQCVADYGPGATCVDGVCLPDDCVAGEPGCPCGPDQTCVDSYCLGGTCVDCLRGAVGCVCFANSTCDEGARCNGQGLCELCVEGAPSCPCTQEEKCDKGFLCQAGLCVTDPCPPGSDGCPCLAEEVCDQDLKCFESGLCAACTNDIVGCPCLEDACTNNLVCDQEDDRCREALTCDESGCVANQDCEELPGMDAACLASCLAGFLWNPESGICEPVPVPNCDVGAAGSILANCEALHRECVADDQNGNAACGGCAEGFMEDDQRSETCIPRPPANCQPEAVSSLLQECTDRNRSCVELEADAQCGECLADFGENEFGDCIPQATCEEAGCADRNRICLGTAPFKFCGACLEGMLPGEDDPEICAPPLTCLTVTCPADQFCIQKSASQAASCITDPCAGPSQAWTEMDGGKCVECEVDCNNSDLGETGRIWPFTLAGSKVCICETEPGYYWDDAPRAGVPCDADQDGWVRSSARSSIESSDPALRGNAHCNLRTINRFALRNEYQQELEIYLCLEDPTLRRGDQGACEDWRELPLYESVRNDKQEEMDLALETDVPSYATAGVGRRPLASETNSLTKGCTEKGDYNHNGFSDISEWHGMPRGGLGDEEYTFASFSFFLELDRGWWEPNQAPGAGRYVIQERSRCDPAFPMVYATADQDYWRECTRSRDGAFNPADGPQGPEFGLEFARWSCDQASGGCPVPPPPTEAVPAGGELPPHGLCSVTQPLQDAECDWPDAPWLCLHGSVWRGMSHHSQFRCVKVAEESSVLDPVLPPSAFDQEYRFNQCHIACAGDDPNCLGECSGGTCLTSSSPPAQGPNPFDPVIVCEQQALPLISAVGFALTRFVPGQAVYTRGCVDEWQPDQVNGDPNGSEDLVVIPWRNLCPGWANDADATIGEAKDDDFGSLVCGCGKHFGGPQCDQGCPDTDLLLSPGYESAPRSGYWFCGGPTTRLFGDNPAGQPWAPTVEATGLGTEGDQQVVWTLRADLTEDSTDGRILCQDPDHCACPTEGDCSIGYVLR
jgi:hypothetical protein